MTRFLLVVFSLLFIFTCSKDKVDQIKINVPEGTNVPEGMVYIPAGDFIMGHPNDPETEKGKIVTLEAFFIDRFDSGSDEGAGAASAGSSRIAEVAVVILLIRTKKIIT